MIIDELVAVLGYDIKNEAAAKRFFGGMDKFALSANKMAKSVASAGVIAAGAFTAIGVGMASIAKGAAAELDPMVKFADRVGVGFESLQELQFAADQSGASSGEFKTSLETLSKSLGEVARGTGRAKLAFEDYGLSAKDADGNIKSADVVLLELTDKFQTLSNQQQIDLGQKLGMTPGMITMLKSGRQAIEAYQSQARDGGLIFTEKEARSAERFNDAMGLFEKSIKAIKHRIGVELLPVISDTLDGMQRWIGTNQDLIRTNITQWTGRAVRAMGHFLNVMKDIGKAADQIGGYVADFIRSVTGGKIDLDNWQGFVTLMGVLLAAVKPAWAITALLALAIDDVLKYMRGEDSTFGKFIKNIKQLTGVSDSAAQAIGGLGAVVGTALTAAFVLSPGKTIKTFSKVIIAGLRLAAGPIAAALGTALGLLSNPIGWGILIGGAAAALVYYFWDDIKAEFDKLYPKLKGHLKTILTAALNPMAAMLNLARILVDYFWDDFVDAWDALDFVGRGKRAMEGLLKGLKSIGGKIKNFFSGLTTDFRGALGNVTGGFIPNGENDNVAAGMKNYAGNAGAIMGNMAGKMQRTLNDSRTTIQTNNVTVNQTVTNPANAPSAVANATASAVKNTIKARIAVVD